MKSSFCSLVTIATLSMVSAFQSAAEGAEPFLGSWALTLPDGRAGWLGVDDENGQLSVSMLWGAGSVVPVENASIEDDKLIITRVRRSRRSRGGSRANTTTETITAERAGNTLRLTLRTQLEGAEPTSQAFTGQWCPPLPSKPDLDKAAMAEPIVLFDGTSLDAWTLIDTQQTNGWSIQDGQLVNDPAQPDEGRHVSYGNLRTVDSFEDFNLKLEVNVGEGENSGIYLRGIYEIQISNSYGRDLDSHNMGAVYSRIAPRLSAEKPAGQWQTLDLTLLDRHVTVILNGKTIIDNRPVLGCTGGALWSDPFKPGPIYLQGDHTGIRYRNIVLTPITKR